eukprot:scaffold16614_cov42-Phaeocystis_antarctica.AAC.1
MPRPKSKMSTAEWLCKSGRERRAQSNTFARQPAVMHTCRPKRRVSTTTKVCTFVDQPRLKAVQAWPENSAEHSALETPSDFSLGPAFRSGGVGSRLLYTSASPAMPAHPTLSHRHPTVRGGACNIENGNWWRGSGGVLSSSAPVSYRKPTMRPPMACGATVFDSLARPWLVHVRCRTNRVRPGVSRSCTVVTPRDKMPCASAQLAGGRGTENTCQHTQRPTCKREWPCTVRDHGSRTRDLPRGQRCRAERTQLSSRSRLRCA